MSEHCDKCGRDYDDLELCRNRIFDLHAQLTQAQQERDEACTIARAVGKIENERAKDTMRLRREVATLRQADERSVLVNAMNRTVDELRSSVANAQHEERMAKADLATLRAALMGLPKVEGKVQIIGDGSGLSWWVEGSDEKKAHAKVFDYAFGEALVAILRLRQARP